MGKETFSYQVTKDEVVRIFCRGRCVMTLGAERGRVLAADLADASYEASVSGNKSPTT